MCSSPTTQLGELSPPRKERKMEKRYYRFKCITYVERETLEHNLRKYADHYAYIEHNRDECEKHIHVLVTFTGNKSIKRVCSILSEGSTQNSLAEPIEDIEHDIEYLTHEDEASRIEGKQIYDKSDVIYDSPEYWTRIAKDAPSGSFTNKEFIDDLTKVVGFSHIRMAEKYGRDYIKNLRSYMTFRRIALIEMERSKDALEDVIIHEEIFGDNLE